MRGQMLLVVGLATLAMASFTPWSHAATLDPITWDYEVSVGDEGVVDLGDSSANHPGPTSGLPASGSAAFPPPDFPGDSAISGSAAVTITNFPAILTTASLSQDWGLGIGHSRAYGEMTYQFEVSPIDGAITGGIATVPILFNGTYSGGISPTTGGFTGTGVEMNVTSTADSSTLYTLTSDNGTPGEYGGNISVIPGVIYSVFMAAQADVEQTTGGAGAAIDPHFFLDPAFNNLFQIQFSPGIQNAVAATTPIPAALLFFVTGFGGLGLAGLRRRKTTITA